MQSRIYAVVDYYAVKIALPKIAHTTCYASHDPLVTLLTLQTALIVFLYQHLRLQKTADNLVSTWTALTFLHRQMHFSQQEVSWQDLSCRKLQIHLCLQWHKNKHESIYRIELN